MKSDPFEVKIFIPKGDPSVLSIYSKPNWTGQGLLTTSGAYREAKKNRDEFDQPGIYILVSDEEIPVIYIGEGDCISSRLDQHVSRKGFWSHTICFVCSDGSLNTTFVKYLEHKLLNIAKEAESNGRCKLNNTGGSNEPTMTEADKVTMNTFLENILQLLPVMHFSVLEKSVTQEQIVRAARTSLGPLGDSTKLYINSRGTSVVASGYDTPKGFIVCEGAILSSTTPGCPQHTLDIRQDLVSTGVIKSENGRMIFTKDYNFNTPSGAACVVLGRSSNGLLDWRDKEGITLKKLRKQSVEANEQELVDSI